MPVTMTAAAMTAVPPTPSSLRNENSSPMANSRKMTPMSAQILMLAGSVTEGTHGTAGPATSPATM